MSSDSPAPVEARAEPLAESFTPEYLRQLHRSILLPRMIEEKMLVLLRQGKLSKWFSGIGQEAIATGVVSALEPDDYILPMHRNLGVFTGRDLDLERLLRQLLGKEGGFTKGRDRTFHFGHLEKGIVGMISHLGAMLPVACGLALAAQLKGEKRVAAAFTGDGATSEGDFHEALNLAAVWKLPVLFVIENNQYGLSTPVHEQYACRHLADRGLGYGMPGLVVDGNDVLAVVREVGRAAERARRGEGPTLLEFETFRMRGHEEASGTDYVPKEALEEGAQKDPVLRLEKLLLERGVLSAEAPASIRAAYRARIDALVDDALDASDPVSGPEELVADVFAPSLLKPAPPDPAAEAEAPERRYVDAISDGLHVAMSRDERVVLLGQDIAEYGGVFKVTEGFVEEFGKSRVRNTPIIES
ncbi:MAG TPA: thiamine pyrophosphate-dependent enzyme, partial [Vicinamibacteria bacterium]